jgi:RecB family exonuclease
LFELAVGLSDPATSAAEVQLTDGRPLRVKGKIDRIDENSDGSVRIIDYKTGSIAKIPKGGTLLAAGEMQLHFYILLAERSLQRQVSQAEYHAEAKDTFRALQLTKAQWLAEYDAFLKLLTALNAGMRGGKFYPYPHEGCRYCDVRTVCGAGRWTKKWEAGTPDEEFHAIRGTGS